MSNEQTAAAVLVAQQALGRALVARDLPALESLLDDGLEYVHSTGLRHNRRAYLQYVQTGPTFVSVHLEDASVLLAPGLAVVEGLLAMTLRRPGEGPSQALRSFLTQIWCATPGGWRLRRAQTTRLAVPGP